MEFEDLNLDNLFEGAGALSSIADPLKASGIYLADADAWSCTTPPHHYLHGLWQSGESYAPVPSSLDGARANIMQNVSTGGLLWDGNIDRSEGSRLSEKQEDYFSDGSGGEMNCRVTERLTATKNLVSERKRRKKLNERLYALRSLVPYITKIILSNL